MDKLLLLVVLTISTISAAQAGNPAPQAAPSPPPARTAAQQDTSPRWTLLVDPVCPVSAFYSNAFPNETKELRVMYFPASRQAKFKNPQSLVLNAAFNGPRQSAGASLVAPFARKDDHWEAIVPLAGKHAMYAIFSVKDDQTGEVDNFNGTYWDVVFCDPSGQKDINGLRTQAESYTGAPWPLNIRRQQNYAMAVNLLEIVMASHSFAGNSDMLLADLWSYQALRDGGNAPAWAKVAAEIDQYMAAHPNDRPRLYSAADFAIRHEKDFAPEFVERLASGWDAKYNDPAHSLRARLLYNHANREPDPKKRLAAYDDVIVRYPGAFEAMWAERARFFALVDLGDIAGAEAALGRCREAASRRIGFFPGGNYNLYLTLARLYLDKGVKFEEALKLIDGAQEALKADPAYRGNIPPEYLRFTGAECAALRARAYVGLRRPELALPQAKAALEVQKGAENYLVLAQALAGTGDKQNALDNFFEAALLPSNHDLECRAELERFYLKQHLGSRGQLEAALDKRRTARFEAAHYVPQLLDRPAPQLQFVTLKDEKIDAATLGGKTLIVNFWSPG